MDKKYVLINAVYAGIMIGIAGIVYLSLENKIVGSLLFSFGLLTIVVQGYSLFTGKIGFVRKLKELADMPVIIIGNFLGTWLVAWMAKAAHLKIDSTELVNKKLDNQVFSVFVLAVFCGVMMYLAIDSYNKSKHIVFVMMPIMIFILSGFEHSIADMFYFHLAGVYSLKAFGYLFVILLGNSVGAVLFSLRPEQKKE